MNIYTNMKYAVSAGTSVSDPIRRPNNRKTYNISIEVGKVEK